MRKEYLITIIWVKFCFNYPRPEMFIEWICKKCEKMYIFDHLCNKFDYYYDEYGSDGVMNRFLVEIDSDLQEALVDYAINVWGKIGMKTKYEEYKSL